MAANSAVEWGSIVKPILAASYGSFNKNDITELAKAIIKSESELLNHDEKYETFYTTLSALAADYISSSASAVCRSQVSVVCGACRILVRYLLSRLQMPSSSDLHQVMVSTKQLLLPIKALCSAKSMLSKSDQLVLVAIMKMKSTEVPPHIKTSMPGEGKEVAKEAVSSSGSGKASSKPEARVDLSSVIMEQLTCAVVDAVVPRSLRETTSDQQQGQLSQPSQTTTSTQSQTSPSDAASSDMERVLSERNIAWLKAVGAGDVLLDMCLQLPHLARYLSKYNHSLSKKGLSLPSSLTEAHHIRHSLQAVVADLSVVQTALSLPVLEPLTQSRLEKLTNLSMTCLYAALSTCTASSIVSISTAVSPKPQQASSTQNSNSKQADEEINLDTLVTNLAEKALEISNLVMDVIKSSTRTGGNVAQNYTLFGAWMLVSGLHGQFLASSQVQPSDKPLKDEKGKSPSKSRESRINILKVQQGFGVVSVALCREAMRLVAALLEDAQFEEEATAPPALDMNNFTITSAATPLQRATTILSALPFTQFLFYVVTVSYRKACSLKRIEKHPAEGDTFSTSDSTTYYDDDMSLEESSPDPVADEDSEPLLGLWFEETISLPEGESGPGCDGKGGQSSTVSLPQQASAHHTNNSSLVPDKAEPNGYIMLATQIFRLMNKYLVNSDSSYLTKYIETGLAEQQMIMLAAIIRDLDRETARTDTGTISVYFGATLGQLYSEFSQALSQYCHNVLVRGLLGEGLLSTLLMHLGVSPTPPDASPWPLQVYPRTLAVLAQALLLMPQPDTENSCLNIWNRLINTLVDSICSNQVSADVDNEDVNVEHAQLVLFLFHMLNLMQKKSVLMAVAAGVIKVSEKLARSAPPLLRDSQLLHLSRLILLLDYLLKYLYDPPSTLFEQVQWNLLSGTTLMSEEGGSVARMYCPWSDIEGNFRKLAPQDEFSMRPRFYALTYGEYNNQELPKLDGLASNFIQTSPEKLKYPLLTDALMEILRVIEQLNTSVRPSDKISLTTLCATQYCFTIAWRLVLQMPPSMPYLERLALGKVDLSPTLLPSLIWGPRAGHKTFSSWMKDCLSKQGMSQYADAALKKVADTYNSISYDINLARNTITSLMSKLDSKGWVNQNNEPSVMDLCLLDAVLAKVQVCADHKLTSEVDSNKTIQTIDTKAAIDVSQELMPLILRLTDVILNCTRNNLMGQVSASNDNGATFNQGDLQAFRSVLSISSTRSVRTQTLASVITPLLPTAVTTVLDKWSAAPVNNFNWNFTNDMLPGESCVMSVVSTHISSLSSSLPFTTNPSYKHLLYSLVNFICHHLPKSPESSLWHQIISVLSPITVDACTEYIADIASKALEKSLGDSESEKTQAVEYGLMLEHIYSLIMNYTAPSMPCSDAVSEKVVLACVSWLEGLLDKPVGRHSLDKFFSQPDRDLVHILLSVASPKTYTSSEYGVRVLHFFNKLFSIGEKGQGEESVERLCGSVLRLANVDSAQLANWLNHVILGPGSRQGSSASLSWTQGDSSPPPIVNLGISGSSSSMAETKEVKNDKVSVSAVALSTPSTSNTSVKEPKESKSLFQENQLLLQHLTSYIVKQTNGSEVKESVALGLVSALVPMGTQLLVQCQGAGFPQLMSIISSLALAGSGSAHLTLFSAIPAWIKICKEQVSELCGGDMENESGVWGSGGAVESAWGLLSYVGEVVRALGPGPPRAPSPCHPDPPTTTLQPAADPPDWSDDLAPVSTPHDDDDSAADESDEDSLCNKLCTFTITQKEFMNQHWYHCHSCKMVESVGVCSICARVCHKGHDVTYAKFGNFFCDCGASGKENGICQGLVKRSGGVSNTTGGGGPSREGPGGSQPTDPPPPSLRRRASSPTVSEHRLINQHRHAALASRLEPMADSISGILRKEQSVVGPLVSLLKALIPVVEVSCQKTSPVGCHIRTQNALAALHTQDKKFVSTDQLMLPTLGSQEGAFENVRMNYSGEQGQTIRQLMSAHMIRRVAMCCLASPHGKRQHLAVSHEKGKITILQLSALLKQADSSRRKLTLTRLSSAPIPFTVLSITGNPLNEDFLAVCGLKECHVVTFTSGGSVSEHVVLFPQLETGNFIIRAVWLPGSQTCLALVTADFVKIYDLAVDTLSPQYYFLVPTGKIRDVSFIISQEKSTMLLMSSTGYIYVQDMNEQSSAQQGPFYVTSTLEIYHPEIKESNGQVCAGGVSVYYSHTLRLLFFSYTQGKSFIAPLKVGETVVTPVFQIQVPGGRGGTGGSNKAGGSSAGNSSSQALCQWMEVPNHPGLICSMLQSSNNPVILMVTPGQVVVQEIKVVPAKAKIMDMVAIRHPSSTQADHRTTLILLCEDGSLRIYMASMERTGFWLSPSMQPTTSSPPHKTSKKKKTVKAGKPPGTVSFPVDFFEHCTLLNDVEFGGNDLLQIYNAQQIKSRLNTTGLYIASTKTAGFNIEITNNDTSHVITGVRVFVGNQDIQRVPAFLELGGRSIPTTCSRNRWFDFPLTREESLQADKKLTLTFGPSQDPEGVTMVDSIKVYGKTKDAFGWPEETEEVASSGSATAPPAPVPSSSEQDQASSTTSPVSLLDKMVSSILEVLDGCFSLSGTVDSAGLKPIAIQLATELLTFPTASCIHMQAKSLLAALHPTIQAYHNFKDEAVINYVMSSLNALQEVSNPTDLDTEAFFRLLLMTRAIAVSRPSNLVKFSHSYASDESKPHLINQIVEIMWRLHGAQPVNPALSSVCVPGLKHVEATVSALVEIVHAFTVSEGCGESMMDLAAQVYLDLLLCRDTAVSFSAKNAIVRVLRPRVKRRRVHIPSPPPPPPHHPSTHIVSEVDKAGPVSQPSQDSSEAEANQFDDNVEPMVLLAPDAAAGGGMNVEALLGGGGLPPMLDIPPDADDETMVELAIALSLQDHDTPPNLQGLVNLQALQNLAGPALQALTGVGGQVVGGSQEGGHLSDTTASAGGSDDEGSTAATDGSTLRTSPADQGGSGGSESGGSGVESMTGGENVSGRSSAYGDMVGGGGVEGSGREAGPSHAPDPAPPLEPLPDPADARTLHSLRLATLERLAHHLPRLNHVNGVTAIPFMQVVLMLTSDIDGEEERGRQCLEKLLSSVLNILSMSSLENICERTPHREVELVIMRLLSVLMSKPKSSTSSSTSSKSDGSSFVCETTANTLLQSGLVDHCLTLLKQLIPYWKNQEEDSGGASGVGGGSANREATSTSGTLLKPHQPSSPPDMSPFFLKQYVKGHATDIFEAYPQLLTEMALRLPYQVEKHASNLVNFSESWYYYLCEYMMTHQTPFVRRQVRKLLLFICDTKEQYRQLRDLHSLDSHMNSARKYVNDSCQGSQVSYDRLVELTEHLKACLEVAVGRAANWRQFCLKEPAVLPFLMESACELDESVAQTMLQLLQAALCPPSQDAPTATSTPLHTTNQPESTSKNRGSRSGSKEKTEEAGNSGGGQSGGGSEAGDEAQCSALVRQLMNSVTPQMLTHFMKTFLLETNATNMRWQAHSLVLSIYKNSESKEQEALLDQLWSLWLQLPSYGRKAAQYVDLLGYFSIKSNVSHQKMCEYIQEAMYMLQVQNYMISFHPNTSLYSQLAQYVELDGYFLESDPCLVCNNPELPMSNIKLSSIKIDSKFTTTTQIVKLVNSHTISKITLRITDLKRTKMVKTMNIYYNNRSVQAVVELKNKPAMWHKAKKVNLSSGQTEVKVEFPLPIVACNLMIEYADFYENLQASSETLQCPRCSSSVPANPGVCGNCGENVFQCHKCRAINYDEKDPFLCHACGFCKYAKFDLTLTGRACCAVDPIENDEDRKKTVASINSYLEKADRVYKQLLGHKPTLEMLLLKILEHRSERGTPEETAQSGNNSGNSSSNTSMVNRHIQLLAQRYCTDCKTSFDDLSRIIQKVLACRKKLMEYDRIELAASEQGSGRSTAAVVPSLTEETSGAMFSKCYGCCSATTEHCLVLLRALAANPASRATLASVGLIDELMENNLRRGTPQMQDEVRGLICTVVGDNMDGTQKICNLLMERITLAVSGHLATPELAANVRPDMNLLTALVNKEDSCWELKLRCVMHLFLVSCSGGQVSPVVLDSITLPCLKILQGLVKPDLAGSKKNKDKPVEEVSTLRPTGGIFLDVESWLLGNEDHCFDRWRKRMPKRGTTQAIQPPSAPVSDPASTQPSTSQQENPPPAQKPTKPKSKKEARDFYLMEKFARKWREGIMTPLELSNKAWIKHVLFNPSSRLARQVACSLLEGLCQDPVRKKEILDLLTSFLSEVTGESAAEFLTLYQSLIQESPWKQYLALKGVLIQLADLISSEIEFLHGLEKTTLTSDLSQGYTLKSLTELMSLFLEQPGIRQQYKSKLVGAVLNGYLSLRTLVVQRTRLIDETQDKLLELLEDITTGTEAETRAFMAICIQTVEKCPPNDVRTPVFVFERLCSIIYPEENDVGEFYLTLEKDPQQEDFLQGRMLGNPYSSVEPSMGPLMRDVKNKICLDCELVALLEDDNGMELLVNNKIISLDLPVKEVYKKIWVAEGGEGDSMRVVYRMRGLLGDATEEFVETLHNKSQQEVDNEELYKMAYVVAHCGGLQVIMNRLSRIKEVTRSRQLLQVILKLVSLCVKVSGNQESLCKPELGAVTILLNTLQLCLPDSINAHLTEQILQITETIMSCAASKSPDYYIVFSRSLGGTEQVRTLLELASASSSMWSSPTILRNMTRVLAALTYANHRKMAVLMDHFRLSLDFNKFDSQHSAEEIQKLEFFCHLTTSIDHTPLGNTLKDYILSLGIVDQALHYITSRAPSVKSILLHADSDEWKEFISKPSLKYILRFLSGIASHHKPTQDAVSVDCISLIHRLEGVSSDEHVGSLAENLLEALCTNEAAACRIDEVRRQTRAEKKRLAMAMREKQLGALGIKANDKGQLRMESTIMNQMEELGEETGLVCVICREGYKYQPTKVLGVYTFTKRCNVDGAENKSRKVKVIGYSTVTHFNVVHIDCHMSAVRLARVRDEWESASLQNSNTKCNGLLPLWGPQVPESAFASCLARHNTYLQEATSLRDITYSLTVHDLKLLLLRFAQEKSFHEDSGGGGPQSNMHLIPYLIHMALYVINTTRCSSRENKNLTSFVENEASVFEWCYEAEGPYYWATFSLLLEPPSKWRSTTRLKHLSKLVSAAQVRSWCASTTQASGQATSSASTAPLPRPTHKPPTDYSHIKSSLVFFGLIDAIYNEFFRRVVVTSDDQWPVCLADYIRHNDETMMKASEQVMTFLNTQLLPCASFAEFCDVLGFHEILDPEEYLNRLLDSLL